jgi:uncharacterized membrane protein YvbJ
MFCSKCGKEIVKNAAFCPNCGSATNESPKASNQQVSEKNIVKGVLLILAGVAVIVVFAMLVMAQL